MPWLRSRETIMENEMPSPTGALLSCGHFGQPKQLDFLNPSLNTNKKAGNLQNGKTSKKEGPNQGDYDGEWATELQV